ncbi:MAG: amino acid permease [Erysipelotrichaceae bacterium]|nr:amino acid permease [Erysipelotrichaceae bacterium]
MKDKNKLSWYSVSLMAFASVWGFGNIINGFGKFGGVRVTPLWILVLVFYFVPYALMVGELGSTFSNEEAGVSAWVKKLLNPRMAFYAGWMYFVVHLTYIPQRISNLIVATSWTLFGKSIVNDINIVLLQAITLLIFFIAVYISTKGMSILGKLSSLAGISMLILSILFVVLASFSFNVAPNETYYNASLSNYTDGYSIDFLMNLSLLIFAVGGCEKISPYINKMKQPNKGFPKAMIALAIMVGLTAIFGTRALGLLFDSNNIPSDLLMNGAYYAFDILDKNYQLGGLLVRAYALSFMITNAATIIISIDAPLRMLLSGSEKGYLPSWFYKQDKNGTYIGGLSIVCVVVSIFIVLPMFGIENINQLINWLIKLNSICMPLRYLWVFIAYFFLKKSMSYSSNGFVFIKNKYFGMFVAIWCFIITMLSCIMGMRSTNSFELTMNICSPIVLVGSGILISYLTKKDD